MPVVVVARSVRVPSIDTVRSDDDAGMAQAVEHLERLGHRNIVHLDGGRSPSASERRRNFSAAMRGNSLDGRIIAAGPTEEDGAVAVSQLLTAGPTGFRGGQETAAARPTGIIAFNDRCALGVLDTLRRNDLRVPADVSVVGYDGSRLAGISSVDLTTVGQNPTLLADLAVARAAARLDPATGTTQGKGDNVCRSESE